MTGLGIAADALPLLAGLATLAVATFLLATWLGRWPLWLVGYSLVVLAVVIAFFFRDPARVTDRGPDLILAPTHLALDERTDQTDRIGLIRFSGRSP